MASSDVVSHSHDASIVACGNEDGRQDGSPPLEAAMDAVALDTSKAASNDSSTRSDSEANPDGMQVKSRGANHPSTGSTRSNHDREAATAAEGAAADSDSAASAAAAAGPMLAALREALLSHAAVSSVTAPKSGSGDRPNSRKPSAAATATEGHSIAGAPAKASSNNAAAPPSSYEAKAEDSAEAMATLPRRLPGGVGGRPRAFSEGDAQALAAGWGDDDDSYEYDDETGAYHAVGFSRSYGDEDGGVDDCDDDLLDDDDDEDDDIYEDGSTGLSLPSSSLTIANSSGGARYGSDGANAGGSHGRGAADDSAAPSSGLGYDGEGGPFESGESGNRSRRSGRSNNSAGAGGDDRGGGASEDDDEGDDEDDDDDALRQSLPRLTFTMKVPAFEAKANTAATVPEVSALHGNDETGHWRLLVYPRSHRGDEQWCSAYLAAAVDRDSLGHGWWKKVDFSITAVHPDDEAADRLADESMAAHSDFGGDGGSSGDEAADDGAKDDDDDLYYTTEEEEDEDDGSSSTGAKGRSSGGCRSNGSSGSSGNSGGGGSRSSGSGGPTPAQVAAALAVAAEHSAEAARKLDELEQARALALLTEDEFNEAKASVLVKYASHQNTTSATASSRAVVASGGSGLSKKGKKGKKSKKAKGSGSAGAAPLPPPVAVAEEEPFANIRIEAAAAAVAEADLRARRKKAGRDRRGGSRNNKSAGAVAAPHQVLQSVTRRGTNTFKGRGTTLAHNFEWGYNDLIKVDTLLKRGFLVGAGNASGTLTLRVELTVLESKDGVGYTSLTPVELQDDLVWAVGVAAVPMVRDCLACGADPGAVYDRKKMDTPLHKAASTPGWRPGAAEVVALLLAAGAPVNAVNDLEETPLLLAADVSGCAEICACLLEFGADPTFRTDNGWSPMNCAAKRGRDGILKLLVRYHCPLEEPTTEYSALLHAAAQGHVGTVLLLLRCGADANVTDRHGDTALWKLVDQDLAEAALYMVTDFHASIARCSRDRKKVTKARLMLKHAEKKKRLRSADYGGTAAALVKSGSGALDRYANAQLLLEAGGNAPDDLAPAFDPAGALAAAAAAMVGAAPDGGAALRKRSGSSALRLLGSGGNDGSGGGIGGSASRNGSSSSSSGVRGGSGGVIPDSTGRPSMKDLGALEALRRATSDQVMEELVAEEERAAKDDERKRNKRKKKKDKAKAKKGNTNANNNSKNGGGAAANAGEADDDENDAGDSDEEAPPPIAPAGKASTTKGAAAAPAVPEPSFSTAASSSSSTPSTTTASEAAATTSALSASGKNANRTKNGASSASCSWPTAAASAPTQAKGSKGQQQQQQQQQQPQRAGTAAPTPAALATTNRRAERATAGASTTAASTAPAASATTTPPASPSKPPQPSVAAATPPPSNRQSNKPAAGAASGAATASAVSTPTRETPGAAARRATQQERSQPASSTPTKSNSQAAAAAAAAGAAAAGESSSSSAAAPPAVGWAAAVALGSGGVQPQRLNLEPALAAATDQSTTANSHAAPGMPARGSGGGHASTGNLGASSSNGSGSSGGGSASSGGGAGNARSSGKAAHAKANNAPQSPPLAPLSADPLASSFAGPLAVGLPPGALPLSNSSSMQPPPPMPATALAPPVGSGGGKTGGKGGKGGRADAASPHKEEETSWLDNEWGDLEKDILSLTAFED